MNIDMNYISNMNVKQLKDFCKKYDLDQRYEYSSKLKKAEIINLIKLNLRSINLKKRYDDTFKNLNDSSYNKRNMKSINTQYYLDKGMCTEFQDEFMNDDDSMDRLKFDTIIFKTRKNDYKIVTVSKNGLFEPVFWHNQYEGFQLTEYRRKESQFVVKYEGDIEFDLNIKAEVLFINADIYDFYYDTRHDYKYYNDKYSYTYEDVVEFIKHKTVIK